MTTFQIVTLIVISINIFMGTLNVVLHIIQREEICGWICDTLGWTVALLCANQLFMK